MQRNWRRSWLRARNKCVTHMTGNSVHSGIKTQTGIAVKLAIAACFLLSTISGVLANPSNGLITTGSGTITQNGNTVTVTQYTDKLGIDWQNFSIQPHETVNFCQPGASSAALNRVVGNQASAIYGQLTSNGKVFLVNSNGVLFAPGATVNVGGLVASTLNITDSNFRTGVYSFTGSSNAAVVNQGTISAANGGYVALLGTQVKNEGVIAAQQGAVALGAGSAVTMELNGNELVRLVVDQGAVQALAENKNLIQADAGKVIMTARAADILAGTAVNNSGIIRARSINTRNGSIVLDSGEGGQTTNNGTLDASGKEAGQTGGTVKMLGDKVALTGNASIDVSGDQGGGTALIGGNYQGKGMEQNASQTVVEKNASITADALTNGNGGKVIVWANDKTEFAGNISAQGGINGGNGGQGEVSGKQTLTYQGFVDLRANNGKPGTLLLDPADFTIDSGNAGAIANQLAGANTVISSNNGNSGTNGDIFVNAPFSWSSPYSLTLTAFHDVNINASITAGNGANVIFRADNSGTGSGTVNFSGSNKVYVNNGGSLSIYYNPSHYDMPGNYAGGTSGGIVTAYMLVNTYNQLQSIGQNAATLSGRYALGRDIDATPSNFANPNGSGDYLGFAPLGKSAQPFSGVFDGDGHSIKNLYINRPLEDYIGLFGSLSPINLSPGSVRNLTLENVNITGHDIVGALVGENHGGNVSKIGILGAGMIKGTWDYTGGVAGTNTGTIEQVYNNITVIGTHNDTGGLVGNNQGNINNSHNTGSVSNSNSNVGGVVGNNSSTINECYNQGLVEGKEYVGGISGSTTHSSISNSYNTGQVAGIKCVGGIVGQNFVSSIVQRSYNSGTISSTGNYAGGIAGNNNEQSQIINSYNLAMINGTYNVGGVAGLNNNQSEIQDCYNAGLVKGINYVGGLLGTQWGDVSQPRVINSYWDITTSGQTSSSGGIGKNTGELMSMNTMSSISGWDFTNTWGVVDGISYPYLKNFFATPPQIISGKITSGDAGKTIQAVVDGTRLGGTSTGANGFYYFAVPTELVSAHSALLTYIEGDVLKGNAVFLSSGSPITNLDLTVGSLTLGSGGGLVTGDTLRQAKGGITSGDILYIVNGNDLSINAQLSLNAQTVLNTQGTLALGGVTAGINQLTVTAKDIVLNGTISSDAPGNSIILSAENSLGGTGSVGQLSFGRWLAFAPASGDITNGYLLNNYDFTQYNTDYRNGSGILPYNSSTIQGKSNGLVYSQDLNFTQSLIGTLEKVYDGTKNITGLTFANYQVNPASGFTTTILNAPTSGSFASKDAGNGILVTAGPAAISVKDSNNKPVYGYGTGVPTAMTGNIIKKNVTAQLNGIISKEYDGTPAAELGNHYAFTGLISGEEDQVSLLAAGGEYNSKDVVSADKVTFDSIRLEGSGAGNYSLMTGIDTFNDNNGASIPGNITKAKLTIAAIANTKTYDGTVLAAAVPSVSGLKGTDTVSDVSEVYNDSTVGTGKSLLVNSYTINDGNIGSNYDVTTIPNDQGVILRRENSYAPSSLDYFNKITEVFSSASNGRTNRKNAYSEDVETPFITIINKGINSKVEIPNKSLFALHTTSGNEINVISVIINESKDTVNLDNRALITTIDTDQGRMTLNKKLPDNLKVIYFEDGYCATGSGEVSFVEDRFIVRRNNDTSPVRFNAESKYVPIFFSIVFDNGQVDTYQVEVVGTSLKLSLADRHSFNIARDTVDIGKLIVATGLKVARDLMNVRPNDIKEVVWNVEN